MPRIPLPRVETLSPEQRRAYDAIIGRAGRLGASFQLTMDSPEFTDKWQQMGELLRYRNSLPRRLSELAILFTSRQWDCQYQWHAHEPDALKAGLSAAVIEAIKTRQRPVFGDPDEEAIYDYCRELHQTHFVSARTYQRVLDRFGRVGVVELTALLGYYVMVAMALNAHEYALPAGVTPPLPARS